MPYIWPVVVGIVGLLVGYYMGRRDGAIVARERAEREARRLAEEAAAYRRPDTPTNPQGPPAVVRRARWRKG